jgi:GNAT superfamily N-acetyltransferase
MPASLHFRPATQQDLPAIVRMLADDPLGAQRERFEQPLPNANHQAFEAIAADPNNELVVAEHEERVVGVLQLTFIPYLTHQGSWRALIEGVRVDSSMRGQWLGRMLLQWAIERAQERGCRPSSSSPPTRRALTRSASTRAWDFRPRTKA